MVTITIFFAALFTLFFFLLGIMFKGLASAFEMLLDTIDELIIYGKRVFIAFVVLLWSYIIINKINTNGIEFLIQEVIRIAIVLFFLWLVFGRLGDSLTEKIEDILYVISEYISFALEFMADKCESLYLKSLGIIVKNLDKC